MAHIPGMARKKDPTPKAKPAERALTERLPAHQLWPVDKVVKTSWIAVEREKLNEIASLLWLPEDMDEAAKNARIIKAVDLFESIKPADGMEAMLAVQMVGAHEAAMECLRRAMVPGQTFEGRANNLGHAQKMMSLYARQLAALDKHRGKGEQKVTVKHVHVASGGQAIVGNVEAGTAAEPESAPSARPASLEAPSVPLPSAGPERVRTRGRRK
ncbi:hypothetical protein [Sneathiella sp.]|uniref:hypothetical protein n=1 Tax=Sneathiella sp. TaxID=1964365 RepID=UPI003568B67B